MGSLDIQPRRFEPNVIIEQRHFRVPVTELSLRANFENSVKLPPLSVSHSAMLNGIGYSIGHQLKSVWPTEILARYHSHSRGLGDDGSPKWRRTLGPLR